MKPTWSHNSTPRGIRGNEATSTFRLNLILYEMLKSELFHGGSATAGKCKRSSAGPFFAASCRDLFELDIHDSHYPVDLVDMNRNEDELLRKNVDLDHAPSSLQLVF